MSKLTLSRFRVTLRILSDGLAYNANLNNGEYLDYNLAELSNLSQTTVYEDIALEIMDTADLLVKSQTDLLSDLPEYNTVLRVSKVLKAEETYLDDSSFSVDIARIDLTNTTRLTGQINYNSDITKLGAYDMYTIRVYFI